MASCSFTAAWRGSGRRRMAASTSAWLLHVHGRGGPRDLAKAARCLRRARRAANVGESRLEALGALETAVAAALEDGPPRPAAAPEPTPAPESGHDEGAAPAPVDQ